MPPESADPRRFITARSFGLLFAEGELAAMLGVSYFVQGTPFHRINEHGAAVTDVAGLATLSYPDKPSEHVVYESLTELASKLGLTSAQVQVLLNRMRATLSSH